MHQQLAGAGSSGCWHTWAGSPPVHITSLGRVPRPETQLVLAFMPAIDLNIAVWQASLINSELLLGAVFLAAVPTKTMPRYIR